MTIQHSLTRRDFVGATTLGAAAIWRGLVAPAAAGIPLFVGTYTDDKRREGVFLLRLNGKTGELTQVKSFDAGPNPSFLAVHPNGRTLYAVNEVEQLFGKATGGVRAFAIGSGGGTLGPLAEQMSEGTAPCYSSTDRSGRAVFVANYGSGTVTVLPIGANGGVARASQVVQHSGSGPVTDRQAGPHAHCVIPHPANRFVYAADLGADRVFAYRFDARSGVLTAVPQSDAIMAPGTGPRHLAFHPTRPLLFVSGELNSTVTALRCDPTSGALTSAQVISTLPADWKGANYPADVHVAPNGRTLYVSNRGHNSIAVFSVAANGALAMQQVISTGGDWPRNFSLDPVGRWLLAANQRSNSIVVFARDVATGQLRETTRRIEIPSPVCVRFLAQRGVVG